MRAESINRLIDRLVSARIVRTVKFTIEDIDATERALVELFKLCEAEGTPVQLKKVGPDTWEFWCEEAGIPVVKEERVIRTVRTFLFPPTPSQSLRSLIALREFITKCATAHPRDEETDTPRIMVSQTRRPERPGGRIVEGVDVVCVLNREIIERIAE